MIRRRRGGTATVRLSPATLRRLISLFALFLSALASLLNRRRRRGFDAAAARRIDFPTQTRRMGLTMTERLRDRLRPRWLRLSNRDD